MGQRKVDLKKVYGDRLQEHNSLFSRLDDISDAVLESSMWLAGTLRSERKIMICGNGGSASDAQHFAAELVGRFQAERRGWPAIALTTDTSILTSVGNDYNFTEIFSRQVDALAQNGDLLIAISTSGNSENVMEAVRTARSRNVKTIGLLGRDGGAIGRNVDLAVIIPESKTARIQEAHIFVLHVLCELLEKDLLDL